MDGLGKQAYDAVVVGTGFGGAVAACRLAQAGVDVAIIERGRRFELGTFPRARDRIDRMSWHHGGAYDVRPLNDVLVVQAAGYGGGSLIYANVQMRPPAEAFEDDWPRTYSRTALDPYYDIVAHMLDIRPVENDPATGELPRKTRLVEDAMIRLGRSPQFFQPNLAVRFEGAGEAPTPNKFGALQSGCLHCAECDIGCNVGAKNTLDLNYLAAGEQAGAHVATNAEVTSLGRQRKPPSHVSESFDGWRAQVADAYTRFGASPAEAEEHATVLMAALEGALMLARAQRTIDPLDTVERFFGSRAPDPRRA